MQGSMKAGVVHATGEPVRVEEVPIPDLGKGEVLIRVMRAGLNVGDLHMVRGDYKPLPGDHRGAVSALPFTIGHDGFGEIVEVAPDVRGVEVGDRVIAKCILTCGFCKFCRSAREHLCVHHRITGYLSLAKGEDLYLRYKDGFWAEYCRIPATNVEKVRPDDDPDRFSLVSQIAVGYRALKRARTSVGETVVINGATGVTGLGTLLAALAMGATRVIAVARDPVRLEKARSIDPRRVSTVSATAEPVRERIAELTNGSGANVLVDLIPFGTEGTMDCLYSLEPGGRAALIAANPGVLSIPYLFFTLRSVEFINSTGRYYADYPELIELTRCGLIDVSHIAPRYFKLEEINQALEYFSTRPSGDVPVWPMMRIDWT